MLLRLLPLWSYCPCPQWGVCMVWLWGVVLLSLCEDNPWFHLAFLVLAVLPALFPSCLLKLRCDSLLCQMSRHVRKHCCRGRAIRRASVTVPPCEESPQPSAPVVQINASEAPSSCADFRSTIKVKGGECLGWGLRDIEKASVCRSRKHVKYKH